MATRKIPKDELVIKTIKNVLKRRIVVHSQYDLCSLTLRELRRIDPRYVLSPRRVKKLVLKIPVIEIRAKTKRILKKKKLQECPICGGEIRKVFGKNLLNEKIHLGYACKVCGFRTDLKSFVPRRYIFVFKTIDDRKYRS